MKRMALLFLMISVFGASTYCDSNPIQVDQNPLRWTLRTQSSVYQMALTKDQTLFSVYYGAANDFDPARGSRLSPSMEQLNDSLEVPPRGGFVSQVPALEIIFSDHSRDTELVYEGHEILQEKWPTLRVDLKDPEYGLHVSQFYRLYPEMDLIQKWVEIKNHDDQPVQIENAQSGSIHLPAGEYDFYHMSGTWGRECNLQKNRLTPSLQTMQVRDFRDFNNPPWFAIGTADRVSETEGSVWFGEVEWSGNWRLDVQMNHGGSVQVVGGINFWDTHWTLAPGETFTTPRITYGFVTEGMGGASRRLHNYARNVLMRPLVKERLLPVLYNSWYATTFRVSEDQQLALAAVAKQLGVELFVIDDGWFKGRKDDHAGLGDWSVDQEKFPNGLQPMIQKINDMGLQFGIWVEPEMVNPDSDLYRAHPDWVFHYPHRKRHESRNQLMLNLAREDVYLYLLDSMTALLRDHSISFIKWDYNRSLSDAGWPCEDPATQREVRIRYIYNFHRLVTELEKRFPEVLFECCSGGGGRLNPDNLKIMDQFWASDNTDPLDRLKIQYGFLHAFPAKSMVSWITHEDWNKTNPSLRFRFHVSMCGILGIGNDITQWNEAQRREAAEYVKLYQEIRPLIQHGTAHRLISPFENPRAALQYINSDRTEAVVFQFNMQKASSTTQEPIKLIDLHSDKEYLISGDFPEQTATGEVLMNQGLAWVPKTDVSSALIRIQAK